ncbi:MAG: hypothetical protein AABY02_03295 [Nanoarchaeota archaeon]
MTNAISKIIGPTLIVMVDGVFRPAGIADVERRYGSLDIRDWFELGDEQIDPETIEMTSAAYLGARKFLEWCDSESVDITMRHIINGTDERSRAFNVQGVMKEIVRRAAELGAKEGARYFGVIADTSPSPEALDLSVHKFLFDGDLFKPKHETDYFSFKQKERLRMPEKLYAPRKMVETMLHPTASFYRER